jgi:hypothetical protein
VIALAVIGTLGIFLGEIFVLMIAVALAVFYAALFLFSPTRCDPRCDQERAHHRDDGWRADHGHRFF